MSRRCERIAEVGIDAEGSLYIVPANANFPFVHRAAMQVGWDEGRRRLFSPRPVQMSYGDWFGHVLSAVASEYGVALEIRRETAWINMPLALKAEIEARG